MARVQMADNKAPVKNDDEDQAELDRAYEQMYGTVEESEPKPESIPDLEDEDVEDTDDSIEDDTKDQDSDSLEDDADLDEDLEDELEDTDLDADELETELETLDDEEEPTQRTKLTPDQQKIVDQRIKRELKKVRRAESETSELKAQVEMLTRLVTGQAGQIPSNGQNPILPQVNFQPPQPPKPIEDMNEFEKVSYVLQVQQAQQQAAVEAQAQRQAQEAQANAFNKVMKTLKNNSDDKTIKKILEVDGAQYFTPHFTAALAEYPNSASIMRHLYKERKVELQAILHQPLQTQIAAAIRMAERYNLERKQKFEKKVAEKKAVPPGKVKSAKLPKTTNGGKGVYDGQFLENLSDEQYRKLLSKGL